MGGNVEDELQCKQILKLFRSTTEFLGPLAYVTDTYETVKAEPPSEMSLEGKIKLSPIVLVFFPPSYSFG